MSERKKNKEAEAAMEIADKFKEIEALATLIRSKLWQVEEMLREENVSDPCLDPTLTLGLHGCATLASRQSARKQSIWHNIAFDRGYFETVEGPRKMSKTEIDR